MIEKILNFVAFTSAVLSIVGCKSFEATISDIGYTESYTSTKQIKPIYQDFRYTENSLIKISKRKSNFKKINDAYPIKVKIENSLNFECQNLLCANDADVLLLNGEKSGLGVLKLNLPENYKGNAIRFFAKSDVSKKIDLIISDESLGESEKSIITSMETLQDWTENIIDVSTVLHSNEADHRKQIFLIFNNDQLKAKLYLSKMEIVSTENTYVKKFLRDKDKSNLVIEIDDFSEPFGWYWWGATKDELKINNDLGYLQIICQNGGGWDHLFGRGFKENMMIDLSKTPLIKFKARARGNSTEPIFRIDFTGSVAMASGAYTRLPLDNEWKEYIFDYSDKLVDKDGKPIENPVFNGLMFVVNPGTIPFSGIIEIDDITAYSKEALERRTQNSASTIENIIDDFKEANTSWWVESGEIKLTNEVGTLIVEKKQSANELKKVIFGKTLNYADFSAYKQLVISAQYDGNEELKVSIELTDKYGRKTNALYLTPNISPDKDFKTYSIDLNENTWKTTNSKIKLDYKNIIELVFVVDFKLEGRLKIRKIYLN
ncbi:MAG: hypothetical protein NZ529_06675 [Cytophagaceae bacterium]|nr:hypothetical protein [Cytophagaceae bacterium]MDW8456464.1 hypothetical protein [Cytophagaceae bacterium]